MCASKPSEIVFDASEKLAAFYAAPNHSNFCVLFRRFIDMMSRLFTAAAPSLQLRLACVVAEDMARSPPAGCIVDDVSTATNLFVSFLLLEAGFCEALRHYWQPLFGDAVLSNMWLFAVTFGNRPLMAFVHQRAAPVAFGQFSNLVQQLQILVLTGAKRPGFPNGCDAVLDTAHFTEDGTLRASLPLQAIDFVVERLIEQPASRLYDLQLAQFFLKIQTALSAWTELGVSAAHRAHVAHTLTSLQCALAGRLTRWSTPFGWDTQAAVVYELLRSEQHAEIPSDLDCDHESEDDSEYSIDGLKRFKSPSHSPKRHRVSIEE